MDWFDRYSNESYLILMPTMKIAISIDAATVRKVDELVASAVFPSCSRAIQDAVADKLVRLSRTRLAEQCALLDRKEEQEMSEEFSPEELAQWQRC